MKSMELATEEFVKAATWLDDDDQAAVTALRHAATELDEKFTASLLAQWRGIYNELRYRKVEEPVQTKDEADEFLEELDI